MMKSLGAVADKESWNIYERRALLQTHVCTFYKSLILHSPQKPSTV